MEKEISHYHYNEVKNITFTYFKDGSFDTAPGDVRPTEGSGTKKVEEEVVEVEVVNDKEEDIVEAEPEQVEKKPKKKAKSKKK